ncbi:gas vesicle protein GvpJ [Micromonospora sp. CPCC 206060]|uniref:gas vesicle protein GvpJ n=1 Tax=Micromonospora sp. CPCC 206060 TaxID=3122406 RepID=UPI002FF1836E
MTSEPAGGVLARNPTSELADVVETVLDKGVVIDAQVSVAVVGIRLLEMNARITIASIETYLRFAEAVDRLDINPEQEQGLTDVVGGPTDRRNRDRAPRRRRPEES